MTLPGAKDRQLDLVYARLLTFTNLRVKGDGPGEREQRDRTLHALVEILRGRRPDARLIDLFELDGNTAGLRPARTSSTSLRRSSGEYGGWFLGIVDPPSLHSL